MVRELTDRPTPSWKALLAIFVAGGALLWNLLACTESPMSFSPDGKELAFVTMEPYDVKGICVAGPRAYRLMTVKDGKDLKVIEQTTDYMLTAPAYSPDGKRLAYLRIPLCPNEAEMKRAEDLMRTRREKTFRPVTSAPSTQTATAAWAPGGATTEPSDHSLPSADETADFINDLHMSLPIAVELVVRDAATGAGATTLRWNVPLIEGSDSDEGFRWAYLLARPQFSPDGQHVYVCLGQTLYGLDLKERAVEVLAAPAIVAALSPDGKTLGVLMKKAIGFIRTDGNLAVYRRCPEKSEPSPSGLAWANNSTLAVLGTTEHKGVSALYLFPHDGAEPRRRELPIDIPQNAGHSGDVEVGELAVAPDGKYMVVSYGKAAYFLTIDGKLLAEWPGEYAAQTQKSGMSGLCQPTFSPDSKQVAFKAFMGDRKAAAAIVYFTFKGKQLATVPIPELPEGTTRPAEEGTTSQSATEPATQNRPTE